MERINISKMVEGEVKGKVKDNLAAKPLNPDEFKMSTAERLEIARRQKQEDGSIDVEVK